MLAIEPRPPAEFLRHRPQQPARHQQHQRRARPSAAPARLAPPRAPSAHRAAPQRLFMPRQQRQPRGHQGELVSQRVGVERGQMVRVVPAQRQRAHAVPPRPQRQAGDRVRLPAGRLDQRGVGLGDRQDRRSGGDRVGGGDRLGPAHHHVLVEAFVHRRLEGPRVAQGGGRPPQCGGTGHRQQRGAVVVLPAQRHLRAAQPDGHIPHQLGGGGGEPVLRHQRRLPRHQTGQRGQAVGAGARTGRGRSGVGQGTLHGKPPGDARRLKNAKNRAAPL